MLSKVKLIAEPWDLGPGGYQLGAFPPGWSEWNDRFRDSMRRFWHGEPGMLPDLARSIHGSSDLFEHNDRRPSASINLITSHDGFTLADVVSYNHRHNRANGEKNRDGHSANFSFNYGTEGPSKNPELVELRQRQCRNLLATMFLAQGTPMLLAGDEIGRSQQGNNNAYCQDNRLTWQDWSPGNMNHRLLAFVRQLIQVRNRYPLLHRNRFVHGNKYQEPTGFSDIQWLASSGCAMQESDWHDTDNRFLAMLLAGEVMPARDTRFDSSTDAALVIAFNADSKAVKFSLPQTTFHWQCVFATTDEKPPVYRHNAVDIAARSVHLFELQM